MYSICCILYSLQALINSEALTFVSAFTIKSVRIFLKFIVLDFDSCAFNRNVDITMIESKLSSFFIGLEMSKVSLNYLLISLQLGLTTIKYELREKTSSEDVVMI